MWPIYKLKKDWCPEQNIDYVHYFTNIQVRVQVIQTNL